MAKKIRFRRDRVSVELVGKDRESWKFVKRTVRGYAYTYKVIDENFPRPLKWIFVVRVPRRLSPNAYIEVRPTHCPPRKAFAGLDRRSINLRRASLPPYEEYVYAKVFLEDAFGEKTKVGIAAGDRTLLPRYISTHNMRLKKTVARTAGQDGDAQVRLFKPRNHRSMIKFFLATKAWVLYDRFTIAEP